MEISRFGMDCRLIDPEGLASSFLDEWFSDAPDVVAHTSGSTGEPKEIKLLKSDMILSAQATCDFFGIDAESRLLLPLSTDYIAGKMMVVRAIVSGARLIVERPSSSPMRQDYGDIDLLPVVPAQLDGMLASPRINRVRNLLIGGAPLSVEEEASLRKSGVRAWASFGMTETCSHVALRDITGDDALYTMLPGITADVDSRGCLVIKAGRFSFGEIVTNDVVELESPRRFRWLGRVDNVIISGGIKLHPEIIERQLSACIDRPFYIMGEKSSRWGEEAIMYVEGLDTDVEALMSLMRRELPRYSVPKRIIAVERFLRTSSGKIKRVSQTC